MGGTPQPGVVEPAYSAQASDRQCDEHEWISEPVLHAGDRHEPRAEYGRLSIVVGADSTAAVRVERVAERFGATTAADELAVRAVKRRTHARVALDP